MTVHLNGEENVKGLQLFAIIVDMGNTWIGVYWREFKGTVGVPKSNYL